MAKVVAWTVVALILGAWLGAGVGGAIAYGVGATADQQSKVAGFSGFILGINAAIWTYRWRKSKLLPPPPN
jgi:hypothetical protein